MVWVIYVSTWCFWISNCILYNIFILITKRYFCFVLYPQTIHQQAEDWKWWSVEEGHYDFYYPQHHFIYVLMSPFIINLFLYLLYLCAHFNSSKHSSASAGVQGAFTAFLWRRKSADQPFISVTFLSVSPLCTRSCSAHRAKSGAWTRSVIIMLYDNIYHYVCNSSGLMIAMISTAEVHVTIVSKQLFLFPPHWHGLQEHIPSHSFCTMQALILLSVCRGIKLNWSIFLLKSLTITFHAPEKSRGARPKPFTVWFNVTFMFHVFFFF